MRRFISLGAFISCLMVGVCVLAIAASGGQSSPSAAAVRVAHPARSAALPEGLVPAVAQTLAQYLPAAWNGVRSAQGVHFYNPEQHLALNLDSQGLHLAASKHSNLDMQLVAYTQGHDSVVLSAKPASQLDGTRVSLNRGMGLSEWYINSPLGIEQGFTLARSLNHSHAVTLRFSLHGSLRAVLKNNALEFQNAQGKPVLRYGELLAYDAAHHPLPAHIQLAGSRLGLTIDTHGAYYPVTVDPLFSSVTTFNDPGAAGDDGFGFGLAFSSDGNTALIGASSTTISGNDAAGAAYVFTRGNGSWSTTPTQRFNDPAAAAHDAFDGSVALSADGSTALIGASGSTVSGKTSAGAAYVFTRSNGTWSTTPTQVFDDPEATFDDSFGFRVSLSGDGNTALIGAYGSKNSSGVAYVFTHSNGNWSTTPTQTFTDPTVTANDQFGSDVALSNDGSTALIGASGTTVLGHGAAGVAYVYAHNNGTWSGPIQTFDDPPANINDTFGASVSLSATGAVALIGASGTTVSGHSSAGAAYVYVQNNDIWSGTPVQTFDDPGANANDDFGNSVSLSASGSIALIGAFGTTVSGQSSAGAAYAYMQNNGTWSATPIKTFPDPAATLNDFFGGDVALSADGNTVLVGATGTQVSGHAGAGVAYAYTTTVDLSLALSSTPTSVNVNGSVTYMLTVTNNDTAVTASNLSLTEALPAGMTYVSSFAAGGSCANSGGTVTCTLVNLAPQATWQPSITVTATTAGSITDNASVTASQLDPNTANNSATVTTNVTAPSTPPASGGGGGGGSFGLLSLLLLAPLLHRRNRSNKQ